MGSDTKTKPKKYFLFYNFKEAFQILDFIRGNFCINMIMLRGCHFNTILKDVKKNVLSRWAKTVKKCILVAY